MRKGAIQSGRMGAAEITGGSVLSLEAKKRSKGVRDRAGGQIAPLPTIRLRVSGRNIARIIRNIPA